MADIQVPSIATATPAAADTVVGVQGGAVKRFAVSNLAKVGSFTQAGTGAVARTVESKLQDTVSVKDFGAVGDGTTDDTSAIQAAVDAASSRGEVVFPSGEYLASSTIKVPAGVSINMLGASRLVYSGVGAALSINHDGHGDVGGLGSGVINGKLRHVIRVFRSSLQWSDGSTDTSSIGVEIINAQESIFDVIECDRFYKGIAVIGDGQGNTGNTFNLGRIRNNRYGIHFSGANGGYANQNTFVGGAVKCDSGYQNIAAAPMTAVHLDTWNNNAFINVNFEGGQVLPSKAVYCNGPCNSFINCRWEALGAGTVHFDTLAKQTAVIGGYGNFGPNSAVFDLDNSECMIIGYRGAAFLGGTFGGPAIIASDISSSVNPVFSVRNPSNIPFAEVDGNGDYSFYDGGGKGVVSNPSIVVRATNSSIDFGDTSGVSAPVACFRAYAATVFDLLGKKMRVRTSGGIYFEPTILSDGATTLALGAGGSYFKTANTGATSISAISGGTDGQIVYLLAGDANTTIVNGPNLITRSGANVTLSAGSVMALLITGSSKAAEV